MEKNSIKSLKIALQAYIDGPDEESSKSTLEIELGKITEMIEASKKALQNQQQ